MEPDHNFPYPLRAEQIKRVLISAIRDSAYRNGLLQLMRITTCVPDKDGCMCIPTIQDIGSSGPIISEMRMKTHVITCQVGDLGLRLDQFVLAHRREDRFGPLGAVTKNDVLAISRRMYTNVDAPSPLMLQSSAMLRLEAAFGIEGKTPVGQ